MHCLFREERPDASICFLTPCVRPTHFIVQKFTEFYSVISEQIERSQAVVFQGKRHSRVFRMTLLPTKLPTPLWTEYEASLRNQQTSMFQRSTKHLRTLQLYFNILPT